MTDPIRIDKLVQQLRIKLERQLRAVADTQEQLQDLKKLLDWQRGAAPATKSK